MKHPRLAPDTADAVIVIAVIVVDVAVVTVEDPRVVPFIGDGRRGPLRINVLFIAYF